MQKTICTTIYSKSKSLINYITAKNKHNKLFFINITSLNKREVGGFFYTKLRDGNTVAHCLAGPELLCY